MESGIYRKVGGKTGIGKLYHFLFIAREHTTGEEAAVYIPLRIEPEWEGTVRFCYQSIEDFKLKFEFIGERLPIPVERQ